MDKVGHGKVGFAKTLINLDLTEHFLGLLPALFSLEYSIMQNCYIESMQLG